MVDWTDPCARAAALRDAYFKVVAGATASVSFSSGNESRTVSFSPQGIAALRKELSIAEGECRAAQGGRPKRYAIQAGARIREDI